MRTLACAAFLIAGCNAANAKPAHILSPLQGAADNQLIAELKTDNPGSLCALVSDGHALLMSFGERAVVDVGGTPSLLSYHPAADGERATFSGTSIRISGPLARRTVTDIGKTISHDATVDIVAGRHSEHLAATWTCQAGLPTVRVIH